MAKPTQLVDEQQKFLASVKDGALVVVSHSGGKDSMAMLERLIPLVPKRQMIVVHAHLVDDDLQQQIVWPGTRERARSHAKLRDVEFFEVIAQFRDPALIKRYGQNKTMFKLTQRRIDLHPEWCPWPSPKEDRWCTSDLKRGPINKLVGEYQRSHGFTTVIDAEGLRAEESDTRSKVGVWKIEERRTSGRRTWIKYHPVHSMLVGDVFSTIARGGQRPHWVYEKKVCGNDRCSCAFCIFGSVNDLRNAAVFMPELYKKFADWETKTAPYVFKPGKRRLVDVVGMTPAEAMRNRKPIPRLEDGMLAGESGRDWNVHEGGEVQPPCDRTDQVCFENARSLAGRLGDGAEGDLTLMLGAEDEETVSREAEAAFIVRDGRLLLAPEPADLAAKPARWLSWTELQDLVSARTGQWVTIAPGVRTRTPEGPGGAQAGRGEVLQPKRYIVAPSVGRVWNVYDSEAGIIYPQDYTSAGEAQAEADRLNKGS